MPLFYRLLVLTLVLFLTSGCNDFLAEEPRDVLSPDGFFTSEQEVRAAVNGLYVPLYDNALYGSYGIKRFYMYGADVIEPSREGGGSLNDINNYTLSEARDAGARGAWEEFYRMIQDANVILERVEDNDALTPAARDQAIGETLYLRAFSYYHLTNMFGDVPYYREALPIEEIRTLSRFDATQIREEMVDDLQRAQDLLPDSYGDAEQGRATKWAAATLIVKIELILERWEAARDKSIEIINNSPHRLLDNYADVFDPDNSHNDEVIWSIVFVKDLNPTITTDLFTPRLRDEPKNSGEKSALRDALEARDEGFTGFGLAIPKCGFVDEFPEDDLRRSSNIIENYLGFELNYPYMPKMWNLDQINSPRKNHGENYIVFRLADVYLMAAEAENELNGPTNAYPYINAVRARAYDPDKPLSGLTQQEFREAIYEERRWELAGEGHRRMDLIRWGILIDAIENTRHCAYDPVSNIQPRHVKFPIPEEEIQLNPALLESDPTNNGYR
jgi:hypothetical protein